MQVKRIKITSNTHDFFSKDMHIIKKSLNKNQLKFIYQKQLISYQDYKHKEWSKTIDRNF